MIYARGPFVLEELVGRLQPRLSAPLRRDPHARFPTYEGRYAGEPLSVGVVPPPLPHEDNPFLAEDEGEAQTPQHRFSFELVVWDLRFASGGREAWLARMWNDFRAWLIDAGADELLMLSNASERIGAWQREV